MEKQNKNEIKTNKKINKKKNTTNRVVILPTSFKYYY